MSSKELISATTSAVAFSSSGTFKIDQGVATLGATNLVGVEQVGIQISLDDGFTWQTYHEDSSAVVLTINQPHVTLNSPGTYRVNKTTTVNSCAVLVAQKFFSPLPV